MRGEKKCAATQICCDPVASATMITGATIVVEQKRGEDGGGHFLPKGDAGREGTFPERHSQPSCPGVAICGERSVDLGPLDLVQSAVLSVKQHCANEDGAALLSDGRISTTKPGIVDGAEPAISDSVSVTERCAVSRAGHAPQ